MLPVTDVPGDLGCADDHTSFVVHRRYGERNRQRRAVLSTAYRLVVTDVSSRSDFTEDEIFFALAIVRNDHANRLANRLVGGVAEHALGGGIPQLNDAVQVFADDRVVRRIEDFCEVTGREV